MSATNLWQRWHLTGTHPHGLRLGLGLCLALALGCSGGSQGPPRYDLSGEVTYDGQPIRKGMLTFAPEVEQGNSGPGSGAVIKDGRFTTPPKKGHVGGPHRIRIVGYDGVAAVVEGEELLDGKALFEPYETVVDLPKAHAKQNFNVPAAAPAK